MPRTASRWTTRRPTATACPWPRIDYGIGDNERAMVEHMADTVEGW